MPGAASEKILKRLHTDNFGTSDVLEYYNGLTMVSKTFNFVNAADGQKTITF
jgi:hypothetical protein